MMHYGIFDNIAKVAKAHALVIEANVAKAVFIPHFHTVIAAGPLGDDLAPDVQLCQQLFAGGIIAETRSAGGASAASGRGSAFSSTATRRPLPCRPQATASPTIPPPTMATSTLCTFYSLTGNPTEGTLRQRIARRGK